MFGLLDNPADMARSQLLATYDEIGLEISRRAVEPEAVSIDAGLEISRHDVGREPEPV